MTEETPEISRKQALENLVMTLSSPRLRAPGTLTSYTQTARIFLNYLGEDRVPTERDLRGFFLKRREEGVRERTLTKEFVQLQKLAVANNWPWPFTTDDRPYDEEEPTAPVFTYDAVAQLILAAPTLSKSERFYLAAGSMWGCRREELVRITKRDYDDQSIRIKIAKQKRRRIVEHRIPDCLLSVFQTYRPRIDNTSSLTHMFYRILDKAEIDRPARSGWHSIRRTLRTLLEWNLAKAGKPLSLVADYMGWSPSQKGVVYGGSAMLGVYGHPEILSSGKFAIDDLVYPEHPFIEIWEEATELIAQAADENEPPE